MTGGIPRLPPRPLLTRGQAPPPNVSNVAVERRAAIVRLLETRDDNLPGVRGQWQSFGAEAGEKATRPKRCGFCAATGEVTTRRGVEECLRCHGSGVVMVDGYTGRTEEETRSPAVEMTGPQREDWRRVVDGKLARLRAELADQPDDRPFGWERERERMWRRYDYRSLDRALEQLRQHDPAACAVVHSVYVYRAPQQPSVTVETLLERGLAFLDRLMPDPIRAPGDQQPEHPAQRRRRHAA